MSSTAPSDSDGEFWLFGYGSLIWKPPPHYDLRIPGYITGYVRRFWQASEDHRGTPSSPGRVVTLIERSYWETLSEEDPPASPAPRAPAPTHPTTTTTTTPDRVYGAAYRIPPPHVKDVKAYLDIREINGYSIQYTRFTPSPPPPTPSSSSSKSSSITTPHHVQPIEHCLVYIGLPSNPQFLGRQAPADVAEVIARSTGPSGANAEYLFMLEGALRDLGEGSGDGHVGDLARRVRSLVEGGDGDGDGRRSEVDMQAVENEVGRVRSGEGGQADEETEKISQL